MIDDTHDRPDVDVAVWDGAVRIVHWLMVLLLVVLLATGLIGNDWLAWHMRAGYSMLALLLFRILWGFVGSRNARFVSFVRGPGAVRRYARSLKARAHDAHATHNPLGAWMVIALLAALLLQCALGLFTNDDVLYEGPLVRHITKDLSDTLSSLHRRGWWVVVALASVHIGAVATYYTMLSDDLVRPMFTGMKRLPRELADASLARASTALAVAIFAFCAAAVWWLVTRF
ncbi:MAG: cytochrome b/b6 domain-containing protein [Betaproteobacteria bacterium]